MIKLKNILKNESDADMHFQLKIQFKKKWSHLDDTHMCKHAHTQPDTEA